MKITDATLRTLEPAAKQRVIRDTSLAGFGIRITPKGSCSFFLQHGANRSTTTIGRYPIITLSQAREAARRILAQKTLGTYQKRTIRFSDALDLFAKTHCTTITSGHEYERMLRREFLPSLGIMTLDKITAHELHPIFDALTPSVACHAFTYTKVFFNWAIQRSYLDYSPLTRIKRPKTPPSRDRVLSYDELQTVWHAADEMEDYGRIIQLLILWGSRRGEVAALKWKYVQDDWVVWPAEAVKNRHEHRLPLTPLARRILTRQARTEYVFPSLTSRGYFYDFTNLKHELDSICHIDFVLHDLRRSWASKNAEWAPPHVLEKALNHVNGVISGVAKIYNRFSYEKELVACYQQWEQKLNEILT